MKDSERSLCRITSSRLHEVNHRKARESVAHIPAEHLLPWIQRFIEWRAFVLWARAIVEAEGTIPPRVGGALDQRCPGFEPADGVDRESEFWLRLCGWIDHNIFREAEDGHWLLGLEHYSCRDFRAEQLWLYWEHCDAEWQRRRPSSYPIFDQWHDQAREWRFPKKKKAAWNHADRVAPARLKEAISHYEYCESFAYWARSLLTAHRGMPEIVARRLVERCPGFIETAERERIHNDSSAVWRRLLDWIDDHDFASAKDEGWFDAITSFARSGLTGERTVAYWAACDLAWSRRRPADYTDFEDWRRAAASYVER